MFNREGETALSSILSDFARANRPLFDRRACCYLHLEATRLTPLLVHSCIWVSTPLLFLVKIESISAFRMGLPGGEYQV